MDLLARFSQWPQWEHESRPALSDLLLVPVFAAVFPTVRYFLDTFIFEKVGRKAIKDLSSSKLSEDERAANQKKLVKFKESSWKCLYYLTAEFLALVVTYNEPWFTDTKCFWLGPGGHVWPDQMAKFPPDFLICPRSLYLLGLPFVRILLHGNTESRVKLKVLYGFAGGFYTYSIFALLFWETRRSDFGVSMSHHVATLVLIVFSYLSKLARVGSVVLAIHDASDIFLEIGKLTKYSGFETIPSVAFVVFALSWIVLRLIYFPYYIIWSTTFEVITLLDKETHPEGPFTYYIFNTLMISLFVLHIYWWILIWRMIVKQVQARGKISDDVRSDRAPLLDRAEKGENKRESEETELLPTDIDECPL